MNADQGRVAADVAALHQAVAEAQIAAEPENEPAYIRRSNGSIAFYPNGPGPFFTNRAQRRQFTGTDHRHDGSKKPTAGRQRNEGWRGAVKTKPKPKPKVKKGPRYEAEAA